jgi:outer membrane protein assembly factor BamB
MANLDVEQRDFDDSIRVWPAFVIVFVGASLMTAVQSGFAFSSRPWADLHVLLWITSGALFCWIMWGSRCGPIVRLKMVYSLFAIQAVLYFTIRVDGYDGDGRSILALRWKPTPDELFSSTHADERPAVQPTKQGASITPSAFDVLGFRGPRRNGICTVPDFRTDWEKSPPKELWRRPVGVGWSSFVTLGEYCFTQEQRGESEAVVCYEIATGREVWQHLDKAYFKELTGGNGPRATPAIDGGRIYALGATGILNCLQATDGSFVWSKNILDDANVENRIFGMVGSPLIVDDKVIVCPGGIDHSVVAFDKTSGEKLWHHGSAESSYCSPDLVELFGVPTILNFNAEGLYAHRLIDGTLQWQHPWISNPEERNNVCQPIVLPRSDDSNAERIFLSSGYDRGSAVLVIKKDKSGFSISQQWANRNLQAKFTNVILHEGYVYGLNNRIMTCIDVETGKRMWRGGRYGHGQLLLANGVFIVQSESGSVHLVEATPDKHHEIAELPGLEARTWNHPVLANQFLLLRNDRTAVCYQLAPKE